MVRSVVSSFGLLLTWMERRSLPKWAKLCEAEATRFSCQACQFREEFFVKCRSLIATGRVRQLVIEVSDEAAACLASQLFSTPASRADNWTQRHYRNSFAIQRKSCRSIGVHCLAPIARCAFHLNHFLNAALWFEECRFVLARQH